MSNETSSCFKRASLSIALVATVFCSGLAIGPVLAQSKESSGGTTVQKNADGTVEAYDEGESAQSDQPVETTQPGDGRIHYRPGTTPYQKKFSDGTTVKRNPDGSIETWDEGETHHYQGGLPVGSSTTRKRTTTKRAKSTTGAKAKVTTTSKTVVKKVK